MESLTFESTVTLDEYAEAHASIFRGRRVISLMVVLLLFAMPIINLMLLHKRGDSWLVGIPWFVLFGFAVWTAVRFPGMPQRVLRPIWQSVPTFHVPLTVTASDDGVREESVHFRTENRWSRYTHWSETKNLLILHEGKAPNIYPKRAIGSEANIVYLRGLAQRHIGRDKPDAARGFQVISVPAASESTS